MAKRVVHEEHENHERWLVSYADFITLLFAFFVVLYATSRVDTKKQVQVENSIKFAMHFKGTGGIKELSIFPGPPTDTAYPAHSPFHNNMPMRPQPERELEQLRKKMQEKLKKFLLERKMPTQHVTLELEGRRLTVRLSAAHFFDPSQAAIRPEMIPVLDAIASELTKLGRVIRIEGHTDASRVINTRFRDNWELSSARAAAIASYIQRAYHYDGKLLAATGYADSRPIVSNDSPGGREINRRVEMVLEVSPGEPLHLLSK